jgi:hypothetical protein
MYTGNLIDELFATVERAELRVMKPGETTELERWYMTAHQGNLRGAEQSLGTNLLGVA